jgi:hypothetical protein
LSYESPHREVIELSLFFSTHDFTLAMLAVDEQPSLRWSVSLFEEFLEILLSTMIRFGAIHATARRSCHAGLHDRDDAIIRRSQARLACRQACTSQAVSALRRCRRRFRRPRSPTDAAHALAFVRGHRIDQLASSKLPLPIRFGTI